MSVLRPSRFISILVLVLSLVTFGFGAAADGIQLNRYAASETPEDGFAMSRPQDQGHLRLGVSLHLDYANDPLVYESEQGERGSESSKVVAHQLSSQLGISLGLIDRLVVFTGLRANLLMTGEEWTDPATGLTATTADGPGLGDVTFGARAEYMGSPRISSDSPCRPPSCFPPRKRPPRIRTTQERHR